MVGAGGRFGLSQVRFVWVCVCVLATGGAAVNKIVANLDTKHFVRASNDDDAHRQINIFIFLLIFCAHKHCDVVKLLAGCSRAECLVVVVRRLCECFVPRRVDCVRRRAIESE